MLHGREVVFVFSRTAEVERALSWLITLDVTGDAITCIRGYYFSPELIAYAAEALGVPCVVHGYRP